MNDNEAKILTMISSAGDSRSKAIEALQKVKTGDYEAAHKLLEEAKQVDLAAHKAQTELITAELNAPEADRPAMTLLMAHAQDHYMAAQLARDLIGELVEVFEAKDAK